MCDAVSIAMGTLSVVKSFTDYQASNEAADAQGRAARDQYESNMAALKEQQTQINQDASDKQSIRALEAMKERGRLNATSGEMGVTGNSVDKALQESLFNEGTDISTIEANRKNGVTQNTRSMSAAGVQYQSNVNQAEAGRTSALTAGLQIGTGVVGAYNLAETRAANKKPSTAPVKGSK
jgi:multidrug resistance efflux pump